jgi:uncharacterized protein
MRARLLAVLLLLVGAAAAAAVPAPALQARVTDLTGTLTPAQRQALETRLADFERQKGSQVAVLMLPTTQPETIEQFAIRVAEQWKLGREKPDDGVLLVVAKDDRALRIEVGYGLEGAIPDAIAKRVIEEVILPRLREGDFHGGLQAGVERILGLIEGESLPPPPAAATGDPVGGMAPLLLITLIVGQFLRTLLGPLLAGLLVGGALFGLVWTVSGALGMALLLGIGGFMLTLTGMIGAGGWASGGGRRGGGFGGLGGGGFRGGGGGFGGGGASGRW